ncbi:uncharacterized protein LOC136089339 [Hydra vulgaris]|uniref:Uncharacterized protein LOC136089339 n=1 Tax=Hydra vulgaris TaxID=6087 RepID=A0ABM4DAK4_HYDVU
MYAIVLFNETNTTDYVPLTWISGVEISSLSSSIKNKISVEVYWPNGKNFNLTDIAKAKNNLMDPDVHWPLFTARILGIADSLTEARSKAKRAEDTSNLDTSEENALKRVKRCKMISSSENEEEDYDQILPSKKKTWHKKRKNDAICVTQVDKPAPPFIHKKPQNLLNLYGSDIELSKCDSDGLPAARIDFEIEKSNNSASKYSQLKSILMDSAPVQNKSSPFQQITTCPTNNNKLLAGESVSLQMIANLLATVISNQEDMKKTQAMHTAQIQSIRRKLDLNDHISSDLPEGIPLPAKSMEEIEILTQKLENPGVKKIVAKHIADIGGENLRNFIMRSMPMLLDSLLARSFNLTGQKGKQAFKTNALHLVLCSAVKLNPSTKSCTQKEIEAELSTWFANSRDRGSNSRRSTKFAINVNSTELDAVYVTPSENLDKFV